MNEWPTMSFSQPRHGVGIMREAVFQSLKQIDAGALARSGKKFY